MMNVKNRIASFEAKNKQVSDSKHSPPDKNHDALSTTQAATAAVSDTRMASQNRRNRLAADSHARQNNNTLASRRRMRQQMRRKATETTTTASSSSSFAPTTTMQSSSTSATTTALDNNNNNSFSTTTPSRHQQKVQAFFQSRRQLTSNRRFVHTVSHESSDEIMGSGSHSNNNEQEEGDELMLLSPNRRLSPSRIAKSYRMQRMKNNGTNNTNTTQQQQQQDGSYQEDVLLSLSTNDDEATLTSVRQVVNAGAPAMNHNNSIKSQDIHRNFNHDNFGTTNDNNTKQSWLSQGGDAHQNSVVLRTASSSDYESDGNHNNKNKTTAGGGVTSRQKNRSAPVSAMGAFMSHNSNHHHSSFRHYDEEDDRTFDYGSLLEETSTQGSFDTQQREAQRKAKEEKDQQASVGFDQEASSPLINKEDVEFYKNAVDSGVAKAGVGVVAAGAVGGLLLGPVGILLGVAAVGIGVGAMQIPEEQRANVKEKAASAVFSATDKLSTSCGTACIQSGIVDQLPPEMTQCYTGTDAEENTVGATAVVEPDNAQDTASKGASEAVAAAAANDTSMEKGGVNDSFNSTMRGLIPEKSTRKSTSPSRRAACLREVRIVPVNQIHGLSPIQQPRAWLDVMASANTTIPEKNEAMEEIAILAKDKKHARVFLDEGILDSLMWIIRTYLTKRETFVPVTQDETFTVKLAACCCVTLGKAHCALVHTGGDLLLMSMYEHGKVPEDRQLAQMLYETPHHTFEKDVFVLKPLTMPQAQELAKSITQLAGEDGAAGNPKR